MKGFSLVELLTVVAIIAILSAMGVNSYKQHTKRAKQSEAKQSLSFVWNAETLFRENFGFYHENLIAIGAIPSGVYNYDIGFGKNAVFETDSKILKPFPLSEMLNVRECTNFYEICKDNTCIKEIETDLKADSTLQAKAKSFDPNTYKTWCEIKTDCDSAGDPCLKQWTGAGDQLESNAKADKSEFKAFAIGKVESSSIDVWSITQTQVIEKEE